ncbi:hypothetical protein [Alteromonas facilis]|uniref:hypothetical protein n=1 Tax=Alteromonas facilis TaxID=2048004 RepID=UPI000C291580|nr:hypothetical protein [Alteromonas facilis]
MSILGALIAVLFFIGTPITVYTLFQSGPISNEIILLVGCLYVGYLLGRILLAKDKKRNDRNKQKVARRIQ